MTDAVQKNFDSRETKVHALVSTAFVEWHSCVGHAGDPRLVFILVVCVQRTSVALLSPPNALC